MTNKGLATKPLAWEVTKAQKGCRQKDAQNYSWLLLWRADGLQPQQKARKPNPPVNQWLLLLQPGPSKHMPEGRYGAGLRRRGLTPRSLRVGRTVSTNKRLEEQARKKWSHVRTSLTPVWCHSGRYPETAVAPGQLLSHTCFGVEVLHLIPVCQTKIQGTCSMLILHMEEFFSSYCRFKLKQTLNLIPIYIYSIRFIIACIYYILYLFFIIRFCDSS